RHPRRPPTSLALCRCRSPDRPPRCPAESEQSPQVPYLATATGTRAYHRDMSLTMGTAPFGHDPAGRFNVEAPDRGRLLYIEDSPRRVRGYLGDELVVDSRRVKLLHEHAHLPVWYFPLDDLRQELLEPTDHHTHCPKKGDASYYSVRV